MVAAWRAGDLGARGTAAAIDDFFAHLRADGRGVHQVTAEDFRVVGRNRTRFRTLMSALGRFAPWVPLAEAAEVRRAFDAALNARYAKPRRGPRRSPRLSLLPEHWPPEWREALPALDRSWRGRPSAAHPRGRRHGPLRGKSRESVVQAVGMLAAARADMVAHGLSPGTAIDPPLIDGFVTYLLPALDRSPATVADYVERTAIFARRGRLVDADTDAHLSETVAILRDDEAGEDRPQKAAALARFRARYTLVDVIHRAIAMHHAAQEMPAHTGRRVRLHQAAAILAVEINACDRVGDLAAMRIGREARRAPDGTWRLELRQRKSRRRKALPLWPWVGRILDAFVFADRPDWMREARLAEIDGLYLFSLAAEPIDVSMPSAIVRREFGVGAHLWRTLVSDLIRRHDPNAVDVVRTLLGHSTRHMQEAYRSEFSDTAAMKAYHDAIAALRASCLDAG